MTSDFYYGLGLIMADDFAAPTPFSPIGGVDTNHFKSRYPWGASGQKADDGQRWLPGNQPPELQRYDFSAYDFNTPGALTINASQLPTPIDGQTWLSGMISTWGLWEIELGYFEVRAKMPPGKGGWPAIWCMAGTLYDSPNALIDRWPPETDIEMLPGINANGEGGPTKMHIGYITGTGSSHHTEDAGWLNLPADITTGFHRYGIDFQQDAIRWYFDGQLVGMTPANDQSLLPMYLLINLAIGGWAGPPTAGATFQAQIDYVWLFTRELDDAVLGVLPARAAPDGDTSLPIGARTANGPVKTGAATVSFVVSTDDRPSYSTLHGAQFKLVIDGVVQPDVMTASVDWSTGQTATLTLPSTPALLGAQNVGIDFIDSFWYVPPNDPTHPWYRHLIFLSMAFNDAANGYSGTIGPAQCISNAAGPMPNQGDTIVTLQRNGIATFAMPHP